MNLKTLIKDALNDEKLSDKAVPAPPAPKPIKRHSKKLQSTIQKRFQDDYDAIYLAYTKPEKHSLTHTQLKQLSRWKFARMWFSEFSPKNDYEVVKALREEYGISEKQAYTDVQNCKRLFASVDKVNEEFEKVMLIENIKQTRLKAATLGTVKSLEVVNKCNIVLAKLHGFDKEKDTAQEPKIVQVLITADPLAIGAKPIDNLDAVIKNFKRKKDEAYQREILDVDYEELVNNPRNESDHQRD